MFQSSSGRPYACRLLTAGVFRPLSNTGPEVSTSCDCELPVPFLEAAATKTPDMYELHCLLVRRHHILGPDRSWKGKPEPQASVPSQTQLIKGWEVIFQVSL